jgi:hypothetical protein
VAAFSTARTYIRRAEHRTEIEAARTGDIALTSIRAALRLIAKPKVSRSVLGVPSGARAAHVVPFWMVTVEHVLYAC